MCTGVSEKQIGLRDGDRVQISSAKRMMARLNTCTFILFLLKACQ
jgi:hypothetical protein